MAENGGRIEKVLRRCIEKGAVARGSNIGSNVSKNGTSNDLGTTREIQIQSDARIIELELTLEIIRKEKEAVKRELEKAEAEGKANGAKIAGLEKKLQATQDEREKVAMLRLEMLQECLLLEEEWKNLKGWKSRITQETQEGVKREYVEYVIRLKDRIAQLENLLGLTNKR